MTFNEAIEALKKGLRIRREAWNEKYLYVSLFHRINEDDYEPLEFYAKLTILGERKPMYSLDPYKDSWIPHPEDEKSEDWVVVEDDDRGSGE